MPQSGGSGGLRRGVRIVFDKRLKGFLALTAEAVELDGPAFDLFLFKNQFACFTFRHNLADQVDCLGLVVCDDLQLLMGLLSLLSAIDTVEGESAKADVINLVFAGEITEHDIGAMLDSIPPPPSEFEEKKAL
jgi:hypothetical protein